MARKLLFGLIYCVVFYFGACMLIGGIVGGVEGAKYPGDIPAAQQAGRAAAAKAVSQNLPYIAFGSVALAILGSGTGFLPGTKNR